MSQNNKTNANRARRTRQKQARSNLTLHIEPPIPRTQHTGNYSKPGTDKRKIANDFANSQKIKSSQTIEYLENSLMPRRSFGQVKAAAQKTSRFIATTRFEIPPNANGTGAIIFDTNPAFPVRYLKQLGDPQQYLSKGSQSMHHITTTNSNDYIDTQLPLVANGQILKPEPCGGKHYENGGVRSGGFLYPGQFSGDVNLEVKNNNGSAVSFQIMVSSWSTPQSRSITYGTSTAVNAGASAVLSATLPAPTVYGLGIAIRIVPQIEELSIDIKQTSALADSVYAWVPLGFIGTAPGTTIAEQLLRESSSFAVTAADCLVSNYNNQFVANGLISMMEIPPLSYEDLPATPQSLINYIPASSYTQKLPSAPLRDGGHYSWAPQKLEDVELHPIPTNESFFLYGAHNRPGALFAFASQDDSHQQLIVTINMNIEFISNEKVVPPRVCPHNIVLFSHWMSFLAETNRFSSNKGHLKKVTNMTKKFLTSDEGKQLLKFLGKTALTALAMI